MHVILRQECAAAHKVRSSQLELPFEARARVGAGMLVVGAGRGEGRYIQSRSKRPYITKRGHVISMAYLTL